MNYYEISRLLNAISFYADISRNASNCEVEGSDYRGEICQEATTMDEFWKKVLYYEIMKSLTLHKFTDSLITQNFTWCQMVDFCYMDIRDKNMKSIKNWNYHDSL